MAKFDFGAACAAVAVSHSVKVKVDGVSFKLDGECDGTDEGLAKLAKKQEGEVKLTYPKIVTETGKVQAPVKHLLPDNLSMKLQEHTKANLPEEAAKPKLKTA